MICSLSCMNMRSPWLMADCSLESTPSAGSAKPSPSKNRSMSRNPSTWPSACLSVGRWPECERSVLLEVTMVNSECGTASAMSHVAARQLASRMASWFGVPQTWSSIVLSCDLMDILVCLGWFWLLFVYSSPPRPKVLMMKSIPNPRNSPPPKLQPPEDSFTKTVGEQFTQSEHRHSAATQPPQQAQMAENHEARNPRRRRLATDVIGQLEDRLRDNDRDVATWLELISITVQKDKTEDVREVYERFLKKFPFLSQQWIAYIEYELSRGEFDSVSNIFKRCLPTVTGVGLWTSYVNFVRRNNNLITGGEEARRVIFQAYELAAGKVGMDPGSGSFWAEYLNFINDWNPNSTFDEQQKMDLKRKVYKRALVIPLNNLEQLWTEYTAFENDLNATTARKFIGDLSGAYMNARSLYREWANVTKGLDRSLNVVPSQNEYDSSQLNKWRSWVKWEKQNRSELTEEAVVQRVDYVYTEALQKMVFYPELWFEYAEYARSNEHSYSNIKVQSILNESLLVNPTSFALNFKLIELYELENNSALVRKKYDALIGHLTQDHERLDSDLNELKDSIVESELAKRGQDLPEGEEVKPLTDEEKDYYFKNSSVVVTKSKECNKLAKIITLAACQYMKCIKRLEGLMGARAVFKQFRTKKITTSQLFVQNAYLEAESSQSVSLKVFELAIKRFPNDGELSYNYLTFLVNMNDDTTLRTAFETQSKKEGIETKWVKEMFKLFMKFELKSGQMANVDKLEKKYFELFPDDSRLMMFADRYSLNSGADDFVLENDLIRSVDLKNSDATKRGNKRRVEESEERDAKRPHTEGETTGDDYTGVGTENTNGGHTGSKTVEDDGSEFVSDEIYNLLRVLPNASHFDAPIFNTSKLINLLGELN